MFVTPVFKSLYSGEVLEVRFKLLISFNAFPLRLLDVEKLLILLPQ